MNSHVFEQRFLINLCSLDQATSIQCVPQHLSIKVIPNQRKHRQLCFLQWVKPCTLVAVHVTPIIPVRKEGDHKKKKDTEICQWHRALQLSPAGLVVTQDVNQPCESSVSLTHLHEAPCSQLSLLTTGINSTAYQLPSGLLCWLQLLLSFLPASSAPYKHWAEGFPHVSFSHKLVYPTWYPRYQVALVEKVALSPGTWSLWLSCLYFSLSIKPAHTHFETCGSCSAININIPLYLSPWGQHSKPFLLLFLDVLSFS